MIASHSFYNDTGSVDVAGRVPLLEIKMRPQHQGLNQLFSTAQQQTLPFRPGQSQSQTGPRMRARWRPTSSSMEILGYATDWLGVKRPCRQEGNKEWWGAGGAKLRDKENKSFLLKHW